MSILTNILLAKKRPKLGIQLPNAGDDNQSCLMLMVIFNTIEHLQILYYNLYNSHLIYTNVMIVTALRWCEQMMALVHYIPMIFKYCKILAYYYLYTVKHQFMAHKQQRFSDLCLASAVMMQMTIMDYNGVDDK